MFKRIDLIKIIKDHLRTLRDISSNKNTIPFTDYFLFFIFPSLLSLFMSYNNVNLYDHLSYFITAIAILCGFLFNLLGVVYGLMDKFRADVSDSVDTQAPEIKLKKIFLNQIHINISFNILISIMALILLLGYSYVPKESCSYWFKILLAFIYFILILFFLTLLMVLNRIYILMKKDEV
jgi:hypothetical protein